MTTTNKTLRHPAKLLLAVGALCAASLSLSVDAAEIYRWTDANGVVHMSDKRPATATEVEVIEPRAPVPRTFAQQAAVEEKAKADSEEAERAELEAQANTPPAAEPKASPELRCQQERERLSILQENEVVHMQDANGNLKTLTNAEIQQEIAVTEKAIAALCAPK